LDLELCVFVVLGEWSVERCI